MYTDLQGMQHIQGITIARDTEIFSDHSLVITKMELGLKKYTISQAKEERVDYQRIMNIPVVTPPGHDHTILNENVFKGTDFREHVKLYNTLQKIVNDPALPFKEDIKNIHQQLITFEQTIINRTVNTITKEDQDKGVLVERMPTDVEFINNTSTFFFETINNICRHANLAKRVHVLPAAAIQTKKQAVKDEKIIQGIASLPITKQIEDAVMRAKIMYQRIKIIQHASIKLQRTQHRSRGHWISTKFITKAVKKFLVHHQQFSQLLKNVTSLCIEIDNEQVSNIQAIESARGKRMYDSPTKYQTFVLEKQGKQAHNDYIQSIKHRIFGDRYLQTNRPNDTVKGLSGYARLTHLITPWQEMFYELEHDIKDRPFSVWLQEVYRIFSKTSASFEISLKRSYKLEDLNGKILKFTIFKWVNMEK
jgi:hypothetical protein